VKNYLVVSALGEDRPGLVNELSRVILECDCGIVDSRMAVNQTGIVHHLASFFASRSINIEDMVTRSYSAPHTGTPMFSVNLAIGIPANMHIAMLREEFLDFCDDLNLDAVLEPIKG